MRHRLGPRPFWRLRKWYADVVTRDGALAICYVAELSVGRARLHYGAILEASAGAALRQRQSWRAGRVSDDEDAFRLRLPALGVEGTWGPGAATAPVTVVSGPTGAISWQALRLAAPVTLRSGSVIYAGTGYAEVVEVSLPLWRIPLRDLAWGRFVADDASTGFTWIVADGISSGFSGAWSSGSARQLALDPDLGTPDAGRVRVRPDGLELVWSDAAPIRRDLVPHTLLGRLAPFARLLPRGLRGLHEDKRISRGRLSRQNSSDISSTGSETGVPDVSSTGSETGVPDVSSTGSETQGSSSQIGPSDVSSTGSETGVPDVSSTGSESQGSSSQTHVGLRACRGDVTQLTGWVVHERVSWR